ncbi:MAG: hypothetical protein BWX48_03470 [Verrucomicrobia bacterium ADurb.Bin006]|nr:MAG: hypothetical protein BWX48_03470 [Verrucomicrobia bacterium ADurb.Bin006]
MLFLVLGCRSNRPLDNRQWTAARGAELGQTAVLVLTPRQGISLQTPATRGEAARNSATETGLFWISGGDGVVALIGAVWTPVGFILGGAYGLSKGESPGRLAAALQVLTNAVAECHPVQDLQKQVLAAHTFDIRPDKSSLRAVEWDSLAYLPRDRDSVHNVTHGLRRVENDYSSLAAAGLDSVLEIQVEQMGLLGPDRLNPPLQLQVQARVRIVSTHTQREWFRGYVEYRGPRQRLVKWATEEGRHFRAEYQRCVRTLGGAIVRRALGTDTASEADARACRWQVVTQ